MCIFKISMHKPPDVNFVILRAVTAFIHAPVWTHLWWQAHHFSQGRPLKCLLIRLDCCQSPHCNHWGTTTSSSGQCCQSDNLKSTHTKKYERVSPLISKVVSILLVLCRKFTVDNEEVQGRGWKSCVWSRRWIKLLNMHSCVADPTVWTLCSGR